MKVHYLGGGSCERGAECGFGLAYPDILRMDLRWANGRISLSDVVENGTPVLSNVTALGVSDGKFVEFSCIRCGRNGSTKVDNFASDNMDYADIAA